MCCINLVKPHCLIFPCHHFLHSAINDQKLKQLNMEQEIYSKILPVIKFTTNCSISQHPAAFLIVVQMSPSCHLFLLLSNNKPPASFISRTSWWQDMSGWPDVNSLHGIFHWSVELSHRARTLWKRCLLENMLHADAVIQWYNLISI